jgi:hypothetical protein
MNPFRLTFTSLLWLVACTPPPADAGADASNRTHSDSGRDASNVADEHETATGSGGGMSSVPKPLDGGDSQAWPDNRVAAVSLTYDDGLDGQLKHAVPALDARDLKATFFVASFPGIDHNWALPNATAPLTERHRAWLRVAESGHEIAAHTVHHPCASNGIPFRPMDYSQTRMAAELDDAIVRLERLGAIAPLTFAYPCQGDVVGIANGESYTPLVAQRFLAARTSGIGVSDPAVVDLQRVAQKFGDTEKTAGDALIAYVDEALATGGWAVFTFHGIGPETLGCDINTFDLDACALNYLTTDNEAHAALLDYLTAREADVWVAPFKEVALHVKTR